MLNESLPIPQLATATLLLIQAVSPCAKNAVVCRMLHLCMPRMNQETLFLSLLLPHAPFVFYCGAVTIYQNRVIITTDLGCRSLGGGGGGRVDLLHELSLNGCASLLPPLLLGLCLGFNLVQSGSENRVCGDLICRLEDGLSPVRRKTICLENVSTKLSSQATHYRPPTPHPVAPLPSPSLLLKTAAKDRPQHCHAAEVYCMLALLS